ncbi:murein hydrolase activator EnvC [Aliikangiella sp. G2MR2-5]|uniref:murein hydrolase activator EnvC family protein n=1 Tax=Aliikangiella sp. G2MR2-5 TaxID=2788943 RepID=UPI0018ABCA0C|nr:peptidoglycan DD-metalloendopeptidase family protein [Aliikangiella sp. G2MR2-5]
MKFNLGKYLLLGLIATFSQNGYGTGNDPEKAEQELVQLKKEIKSLQATLKSKQKQQSAALKRLQSSEKQIATTSKILRSTLRQLSQKERELKKLRRQQKNLESSKKEQKAALASQIRAAYISGSQEYLKMLLNQEDPEALGRMLVYYDYMNKARSQKVAKLQKTLLELENIDKTIQEEIRNLNLLKQSKEEESERLNKLKNKRKQIVDNLNKEIDAKNERLTELQINAKELQELIDSVREAIEKVDFSQPMEGLKKLKGKLNWPTAGKRIRSYGSRLAEGLRSNGVVIGASEGKPVNAIHYGRVVYADWLRGFGLLVILDHGEGYMSLYGYNQALYKQVGDWVEAGEAIATVGQSGGQHQPGLYFELRHQGKPFNPGRWFR